jgi:urease accessory protein
MVSNLVKSCIAAAMVVMPTVAFAHTGVGDTSGLVHGFVHPISGLDHILAMLMVGIFAWQLGGRALWLVPVTFVGDAACPPVCDPVAGCTSATPKTIAA